MQLAQQRESLTVIADQVGTPTYARDLAKTIMELIDAISSGRKDVPGIYHFTNEGVASWYDLAYLINERCGFPCRIIPITTEEYVTRAIRPRYTVFDKRKIKQTFGIEIPHWTRSLYDCIDKIRPSAGTA